MFKIGDIVEIYDWGTFEKDSIFNGEIGTIVEIREPSFYVYIVSVRRIGRISCRKDEIRYVEKDLSNIEEWI